MATDFHRKYNVFFRYDCPAEVSGNQIIIRKYGGEILHINHVSVMGSKIDGGINTLIRNILPCNLHEIDCTLRKSSPKCSEETCYFIETSIFAIWWKKSLGYDNMKDKANILGERLTEYRKVLNEKFSLPVILK